MTQQYWTSKTSGETWVVQLDRPDGEVKGVAGPHSYRDVPKDARDFDGDFESGFETCDQFQTQWDEFEMGFIHPHADLMGD